MVTRARLVIVPVGAVARSSLLFLQKSLGYEYTGLFDEVSIHERDLPLLQKAWNGARGQYDAGVLLASVAGFARKKNITRALGITERDLYHGWLNFVFGIARSGPALRANAALVSVARLIPDDPGTPAQHQLFRERVVKEAIHEIGHTLGLNHCENVDDKPCVMSFSNRLAEVDAKAIRYCPECKARVRHWFAAFHPG